MMPLKKIMLSAFVVLLGACGSEPSYVPVSERPGYGNEEESDSGEDNSDDKNQGGDEGNQGNDDNDKDDDGKGDGSVTNGHSKVDLGLSVCWAASNLDYVNSMTDGDPAIPGSLFKWGAVTPVRSSEAIGSFPDVGDETNITGTAYDAATDIWGVPWRMPTKDEFDELVSNCEIVWESSGCRFIAPNGNSIYFPAAGYCDLLPTDSGTYDFQFPSVRGYYWSSANSFSLVFTLSGLNVEESLQVMFLPRYCACSIRPVCPK